MILALLLLAASAPAATVRVEQSRDAAAGTGVSTSLDTNGAQQSPLDAERAFAADAQTLGQWTAFRKWAAPDAVMFVPQLVNAQDWLRHRKDPPDAIKWWPTASYVACDGSMAVNTGGWQRPDGSVGYFSTVWMRQPDGSWKWTVDSGDALQIARPNPAQPHVKIAACNGKPSAPPQWIYEHLVYTTKGAASGDNTIVWRWDAFQDGRRNFYVYTWNGRGWDSDLNDQIAAPK